MKFRWISLFLVFSILPVILYTVKMQNVPISEPTTLDVIYPIKDPSAPALIALAGIYAPTENEAGWLKSVCVGMTQGGCSYFTENQASKIRDTQSSNIGSSSGFVSNVSEINEDTQLWKTQITVFTPGKEATSDVYALVRRGTDGNWRLDRIIVGPGISPE